MFSVIFIIFMSIKLTEKFITQVFSFRNGNSNIVDRLLHQGLMNFQICIESRQTYKFTFSNWYVAKLFDQYQWRIYLFVCLVFYTIPKKISLRLWQPIVWWEKTMYYVGKAHNHLQVAVRPRKPTWAGLEFTSTTLKKISGHCTPQAH